MKKAQQRSRLFIWGLIALGTVVIALGVLNSVREPGVDWVSICVGGSVILNSVSLTKPPGPDRIALVAGALVLAVAGLIAALL